MIRQDADLQKLAEALTQVDLDAIADDAFHPGDEERKYEAFTAGIALGKSAGTKDIWEVKILDADSKPKVKMSYFFIGTKDEIMKKLKTASIAETKEEAADPDLAKTMEMEGS